MTYIILAALFFSLMSVLVKFSSIRLPVQELVLVRSIIVFTITAILIRQRGLPMWGNNKKLLLLRGIFGSLALMGFFYTLYDLPMVDAVMISRSTPLFTAIVAGYFLKEKANKKQWGYFLLAFSGIALIIRPQFSAQIIPALVGIGGAFFAALAYTTIRKLRHTDHPLNIVLYFPAVSIIFSLPWTFPVFVMPTFSEGFLLIGIGTTAMIAQFLLTKGLHLQTASRATNLSSIGIVFTSIWGFLLFAEQPAWHTILGTIILLFSLTQIIKD